MSLDFKHMEKGGEWLKCKTCHSYMAPTFSVTLHHDKLKAEKLKIEKMILQSPHTLNNISLFNLFNDYRFKLDLETFAIKHKVVYWNCIWHFMVNGLPFDFLLSYEDVVSRRTIFGNKSLSERTSFDLKTRSSPSYLDLEILKLEEI